MSARRTLTRAGAVLAAAVLLVTAAPGATAEARRAGHSGSVTMTVDSVTPPAPEPTTKRQPLTITLTLTNTTGKLLSGVSVLGERGYPLSTQHDLDAALANPTPSTSFGVPVPAHPAVTVDLPPGEPVTVSFNTVTSTIYTVPGLCLCADHLLIYPLFFSAHVTDSAGVDELLGVAATYVPAFDSLDFQPGPQPVRVNWVWPLLERPHRLTSETTFTDDQLAASVGPDGRLSRALDVVEQVGPDIPLTLLIDPELLDELTVMARVKNPYQVATSDGHTTPGDGQSAASAWLARLHTVLTNDPGVEVRLTPYADPDVEALTQRAAVTKSPFRWSATFPDDGGAMAAHVTDALAGRSLDWSLAWPASGAMSRATLSQLFAHGVRTVILNSNAVDTRTPESAVQPGLVRLNRQVAAALTSPTVESYAAKAVTDGGLGAAALPPLLAELAMRAAQEPTVAHPVVITPPRYVNPDVAAAVSTIEQTSRSTFSQPIPLSDMTVPPFLGTGTGRLNRVPPSALDESRATLAAAAQASDDLPGIRSLLDRKNDPTAAAFVDSLPVAIQRCESSAWRPPGVASAATVFAAQLSDTVEHVTTGVRIVNPSSGSYTFASGTAELPITVSNTLPYAVHVRVLLSADSEVSGFHWTDKGPQTVEANQTRTFKIPTTLDRAGRIKIKALLYTPSGLPLGNPVPMTVRSTALGLIGVVITVVAGVVLAIALLLRVARRLRQRRATASPPPAATAPVGTPEPIA